MHLNFYFTFVTPCISLIRCAIDFYFKIKGKLRQIENIRFIITSIYTWVCARVENVGTKSHLHAQNQVFTFRPWFRH